MAEAGARGGGSTEHLRVVARGGALNLAGAVIGAIGQIGLVLVIARQLDPSKAGEFFALISAFLVFTALTSLGTEAGLGRFLLRFEVLGRRHDIGEALRITYLPVLATTVVFGTALFVGADSLVQLMGVPDPTGATALRVLAVGAPFACLSELSFASTRAFGQVGPTVVFDRIIRSLAQPALVWAATFRTERLDVIAVAWVAPYLLSLVGGLLALRTSLAARDLRPAWRRTERTSVVRREFWSFTWARGLTQVAQLVIQRADIVLIAALRSPSEAAIYTAATRFVPVGQMATTSFQQVLQPRFSMVIAQKDDDSLRELFQTGTTWNILVAWPIALLVGGAPLLYLSVFGQTYGDQGVAVVVVMAISMLLAIGGGPLDTVILMLGRSTMSMANVLAAVVVDIGLVLLLIPSMGILGAALAWFASRLVVTGLGLVQVRRLTTVTPMSAGSLLAIVLSVVLVGLPVLSGTLVGLGTVAELAVCALAGLVYLAAMYALRVRFHLTALDLTRRRVRDAGRGMTAVLFDPGKGPDVGTATRLAEIVGARLPAVGRWWVGESTSESPPGVSLVNPRSPQLLRRMAMADVVVTGTVGARRRLPGARTVHVQTWAGTPLVPFGFDARASQSGPPDRDLRRLRREVSRWDYLVSPSPVATDLLRSAFRYDGAVLEVGTPRNDALFADPDGTARRRVREHLGAGADQRVVLHTTTGDPRRAAAVAEGLPADTVLWVRAEPAGAAVPVHPRVRDVSGWTDLAGLFLGADLLLTDYSCLVYDFVLTEKPVVHLVPDLDQVRTAPGLYVDYETWAPGPVTGTVGEAVEAIRAGDVDVARSRLFVETFCPYEDGRAGERLLDTLQEVLGGAAAPDERSPLQVG